MLYLYANFIYFENFAILVLRNIYIYTKAINTSIKISISTNTNQQMVKRFIPLHN